MSEGIKIQIVEDEQVTALDLSKRLQKQGYVVSGIHISAEDAITAARKEKPDIVLLDISLSGRLNGIEAAPVFRNEMDIAVIFLTSYVDKETFGQARSTEPFAYITKPFRYEQLQMMIEMSLFRHQMERRMKHRLLLEERIGQVSRLLLRNQPDGLEKALASIAETLHSRGFSMYMLKNKQFYWSSAENIDQVTTSLAPNNQDGPEDPLADMFCEVYSSIPGDSDCVNPGSLLGSDSFRQLLSKGRPILFKKNNIDQILEEYPRLQDDPSIFLEGFQFRMQTAIIRLPLIVIPVIIEDHLAGCLFFCEFLEKADWNEDDIRILSLLGETIAANYLRLGLENELRLHRDHLRHLVEERTRDLEEARDQAETALQTRNNFLANVSHELRSPLTSIIGFSEMIKLPAEDKEQQELLDFIHNAGQHLKRIINDILDLTRIESGKMQFHKELLDFKQVIVRSVGISKAQATEKGITIHFDEDMPECLIEGDEGRLQQVVLNLLSNAIKFTGCSGSIQVSLRKYQGWMEFSVSDTGIGIKPEDQTSVFETFIQIGVSSNKSEGTGLGLPISQRIVEVHNGSMSLESEPGKGSTFTVHLPLVSQQG